MKEHLLSVGKDCTSSNTEINKTRAMPQIINILREKKRISLPQVPKKATCLNAIDFSNSLLLVFS